MMRPDKCGACSVWMASPYLPTLLTSKITEACQGFRLELPPLAGELERLWC